VHGKKESMTRFRIVLCSEVWDHPALVGKGNCSMAGMKQDLIADLRFHRDSRLIMCCVFTLHALHMRGWTLKL